MGRGATIRTGVALAVALAGAAVARAQLPTVSIDDARVVEGNSSWTLYVTVTLSAPTSSPVDVPWSTADGSAISGQDYANGTGVVTFPSNSTTPQTLAVTITGDLTDEWTLASLKDEVFFIDLENPTNATLLKSRATVTIVDDDRALPGLQFVSAVADGSAGSGRVRLQWRVPASAASGAPTDVRVRWNAGPGCSAPTTATGGTVTGEFLLSDPPTPISVKPAGETQIVEHTGLSLEPYCYALFAMYSATPTTQRATVVATPFDAGALNQPVAWAYSTGFPNVVPPTVGMDAVYTVSTDGVVHAMTRGVAGGAWPTAWNPVGLGKPAHNRSPVVPLPYGPRFFVGTELGEVHAVSGVNGAIAWSRSQAFGNTQLPNVVGGVQGTPAGLFTSWGGQNDAILVGTNQAPSSTFYMLDPVTGIDLSTPYSNGAMGGVPGMPVVDYTNNRVFFITTLPAGALWAFDLGAAGSPGLTPSTLAGGNPVALTYGSNGSPVVRNGRLYFGLTNGDMRVHRLSDGQQRALNLGTEVKGFVFPDRRNGDLYLSTNDRVWAVRDTLEPAAPNLTPPWFVDDIPTPSIVLHWPGTNYLYVGGGNGQLYQIDVSSASPKSTKKSVLLESGSQVGAPSLDGPNSLVHVGSATGVVYAVRVPLP